MPEIMHTAKILAHGKIPFSGSGGDQGEEQLGGADRAGGAEELAVSGRAGALEHARAVQNDGVDT